MWIGILLLLTFPFPYYICLECYEEIVLGKWILVDSTVNSQGFLKEYFFLYQILIKYSIKYPVYVPFTQEVYFLC